MRTFQFVLNEVMDSVKRRQNLWRGGRRGDNFLSSMKHVSGKRARTRGFLLKYSLH